MKRDEAMYTVSVQASVADVVRLGVYFDKTGVYRAAKPAGMLAVAIRLLVNILDGSGDLLQMESLDEALRFWGVLRYPREQLDTQLRRQQRDADRSAFREEAKEMYAPAAQSITALRTQLYNMTEEERNRLVNKAAVESLSPEEIAEEKSKMHKRAADAGIVISDEDRPAEVINEERAVIDARKKKEIQESIMAGIAGIGVAKAEDDLAEARRIQEEIAAEQKYVLDVEPAEATPGVVETQDALKKERK